MPDGCAPPTLAPQPRILYDRIQPPDGCLAEVWWRSLEDERRFGDVPDGKDPRDYGWRSVRYDVKRNEERLNHLYQVDDMPFIGSISDRRETFLLDPETDEFTVLPDLRLEWYAAVAVGGRYYACGYPGTCVYVYDPNRPWTRGTGVPGAPAPPETSRDSNPRLLPLWHPIIQTKHAWYAAAGADGCLYLGAHAEREYVGGGIGWYDPRTDEQGGLREPFVEYDVAGFAPLAGGWKIVYSGRAVGDGEGKTGRLFLFDVKTRTVEKSFAPFDAARSPGSVYGVGPMRILGIAPEQEGARLYVADMDSLKVLNQKTVGFLPARTAFGSDGAVRGFRDEVLVRIAPDTLAVETFGIVPGGAGPLAFRGRNLYIGGQQEIRKIEGIIPKD